MKKNKKIWIIVIAIIILIVIGIIVAFIVKRNQESEGGETSETGEEFVQVLDDGSKINTSSKLEETKTLNGLEFTNMKLTTIDNMTVLSATVTNTTDEPIDSTEVNLILLDKDGNEIDTIVSTISSIEAGASTEISAGITADYSNAYDFRIEPGQ